MVNIKRNTFILTIYIIFFCLLQSGINSINQLTIKQNLKNKKFLSLMYDKFNHQFNKKFNLRRLEIFTNNLINNYEYVTFINEEPVFSQFYDMTPKEFKAKYLSSRDHKRFEKINKYPELELETNDIKEDFPSYFNWVDHGVVSKVKDQGDCGSCWTFSTVGNIEGLYAIRNKEFLEFSEQQLVDCDDNGDVGCMFGSQNTAMEYIIFEGGLMLDSDYPYTAVSSPICKFDKSKVKVQLDAFYKIKSNEEKLKEALYMIGPIAATLNSEPFQFYTGGILNPKNCGNTYFDLNHAIVLVGYGTENGVDYWIIKNSWGEKWGEKGYVRLLRGKNVCGIAIDNFTAILK